MKKILALLMALSLMCGLFVGCGGTSSSAEPAETSAASSVAAAPEASEAEEAPEEPEAPAEPAEEPPAEAVSAEEPAAPAEEPVEEPAAETYSKYGIDFATKAGNPTEAADIAISLPVTEDDVTASLYMIMSPAVIGNINQLADENIAWKTFCEKTGLNLDIHLVHPGNKATEVSLILASQDYYDVMQDVISTYSGGGDQAIEDEFVYDLTDIMKEYAPNYYAKITYSMDTYDKICTESGKLVGFSRISNALLPENGLAIRYDWLEDVGMALPTTIDELHDVLTAFKEQQGTDAAMWLNGTGVFETEMILSAFYGDGDFYVNDDSVVGYGPIEDSFKDYLKTMAQWYSEGLIYPDFYTNTDDLRIEDMSLVASQNMGIVSTEINKLQTLNEVVEGSEWGALGTVVQKDGDVLHTGGTFAYYAEMVDMAITTACEEPEIVCAAFDYLYTEEGALLANYGVEGVTYEVGPDGAPQFSEMMTNDPNSDLKTMILLNCLDIGPYVKDVYRTQSTLTDAQISAYEIWNDTTINDQAWEMPAKVSLTTDESTEYSNNYAEFHAYYLEMVDQFIIGAIDIDAEWDNYVDTMNTLGVQDSIDIYQTAYDRYASEN